MIKTKECVIWIITCNIIIILNFNFFYSCWFEFFFTLNFSFFNFYIYAIIIYYNYDEAVLLIGVFIGVSLCKLSLLLIGVIGDVVCTMIF